MARDTTPGPGWTGWLRPKPRGGHSEGDGARRECYREGVTRVTAFLRANTSEKVAKRDAGGRATIRTFEQAFEELKDDDHRWMNIPNDTFTLNGGSTRVTITVKHLWCRACGVIAEAVSITEPPTEPSFYRFLVPGSSPGETTSTKPVCVLRTHPPPGLTIHYKDKK